MSTLTTHKPFSIQFKNNSYSLLSNDANGLFHYLSVMKEEIYNMYKHHSNDLLFKVLYDFQSIGECQVTVSERSEDNLSFKLTVTNINSQKIVEEIHFSFPKNPFAQTIDLVSFFSSFFAIFFSNRSATAKMIEDFNEAGSISDNDFSFTLKNHDDMTVDSLFEIISMYDFEVTFSLYGSSIFTEYFIEDSDLEKRKAYIKHLLDIRRTHLVKIRPIKNPLSYWFLKSNS